MPGDGALLSIVNSRCGTDDWAVDTRHHLQADGRGAFDLDRLQVHVVGRADAVEHVTRAAGARRLCKGVHDVGSEEACHGPSDVIRAADADHRGARKAHANDVEAVATMQLDFVDVRRRRQI